LFESVIAIPQLEGSTSATFSEMLLRNRNRNSAIAIFSEVHNFNSVASLKKFSHIFDVGIRKIHEKKIGGKKSHATVPLSQDLVFIDTNSSNIFFFKPS
jgi:hypothetical protein